MEIKRYLNEQPSEYAVCGYSARPKKESGVRKMTQGISEYQPLDILPFLKLITKEKKGRVSILTKRFLSTYPSEYKVAGYSFVKSGHIPMVVVSKSENGSLNIHDKLVEIKRVYH